MKSLLRLQRFVDKGTLLRSLLSNAVHTPKKYLVEYSSPNIAKPLHIGHLRSTIVGRFVVNILKAAGHDVTTVNWLGDWGTQFGLLARGFEEFGDLNQLRHSYHPLEHLHEVYVQANKRAEDDSNFMSSALVWFSELEAGDEEKKRFWQLMKDITVVELERLYERLGVQFDHWHYESMFAEQAAKLAQKWKHSGALSVNPHGVTGVWVNDKMHPLLKSDGSTLYLARDVATAIQRDSDFQPDHMVYVVDKSQTEHFKLIQEVLNTVGYKDVADKIEHIRFGRVQGMSTRGGTAVLLNAVLAQGIDISRGLIESDRNTRIEEEEIPHVAEELALSALIAFDLRQHRENAYRFQWSNALDMKGSTGIRLQATHARIRSLERNNPEFADYWTEWTKYPFPDDPLALKLCKQLNEFEDCLVKSYNELDACHLLVYMFHLCRAVNQGKKTLRIGEQPREVAVPRLFLFGLSKHVLAECLKLIGLRPLDRM